MAETLARIQPVPRATIRFFCNDRNGHFTGRALAMAVETGGQSIDLHLSRWISVEREDHVLRLGGPDGVSVPRGGWAVWTGNMQWDATTVSEEDATKILRWALTRGATAEEWTEKFNPLVEEAEARHA